MLTLMYDLWLTLLTPQGKLALVLGAGNQASIGVGDALYKLINCGEVVFLKHNPVNDYLFPVYEKVCSNIE